ncbi:hypothetical protein E4U53_001957, partial [Claviceps sorghi]
MSDLPMTQTSPKAKKTKKLPFKPTALRKHASKGDALADKDKTPCGDGLELFRRAEEMRPIVEADCERRLWKKKQKREEEERRKAAATAGKRPCEEENDPDGDSDRAGPVVTPSATQGTNAAFRSTTPVNVDIGGFDEEA